MSSQPAKARGLYNNTICVFRSIIAAHSACRNPHETRSISHPRIGRHSYFSGRRWFDQQSAARKRTSLIIFNRSLLKTLMAMSSISQLIRFAAAIALSSCIPTRAQETFTLLRPPQTQFAPPGRLAGGIATIAICARRERKPAVPGTPSTADRQAPEPRSPGHRHHRYRKHFPLLHTRRWQGDPLWHRCGARRLHLVRRKNCRAQSRVAGLVPTGANDRTPTLSAAHGCRRPRQSARRAGHIYRRHRLPNSWHQ